ncbi:MAG TPA: CSLREA domain-containing protein [Anaerolineales bacterium]|nr:CSLREA domain-containing protein [Anaerolineales bacterium]
MSSYVDSFPDPSVTGGIEMNAQPSRHHKFNRVLMTILSLFAVLVIAWPIIQMSLAVFSSPFVGQWQASDVNGNDMRLTVSGSSGGPLQITWIESDISLCDGAGGIVRGTGQLDESNPHLLEADLHLDCFTGEVSSDFHFMWRYHPVSNTLSGRYDDGVVTAWRQPDRPFPSTPALNLRVNYGDNWVESFYAAGHRVWITVTENDGVNVKATARSITESRERWDGQSGFQTSDSLWFDAQGNQMADPPDIRPHDRVFGWMDNGATAQVQIGEIRGVVDITTDSIGGTILAPWITAPVLVECLDWGSGGNPFYSKNKDAGLISTNGTHPYSCSWAGEWGIQSGQTVGVGYVGSDGNWVANAFFTTDPTFDAFVPGAIEGYDWPAGSTITVNINDGEYVAQAVSELRPGALPGRTRVPFELWKDNFFIEAGDRIVMTDGSITKDSVVTALAVTDFDVSTRTVSGTYDPDSSLRVWVYDRDGQVATDPGNGAWVATFDQLQAGTLGGASQQDVDGDGTSIEFEVPQTFFVSSTADAIGNDGVCTLREAIIAANTNAPSGNLSGECPRGLDSQTDIIVFVAGNVYSLTTDRTNNDTAADGDLDISDNPSALDLIIRVEGDGKATISQDAALVDDRVLENHEATVRLENLILTGGSNVGGGGGLLNNGTIDMTASQVSGNSVSWDGGGIYNSSVASLNVESSTIAGNSSTAFAGGIMNKGTLTLKNSEIKANTSVYGGGGINNEGTLVIDANVMSANSSGQGGALYNSGTATIGNGTLVGGPLAEDANTADGGGGLFSLGTLTVSDSTVTGNRASYGGGLFNWVGGMLTISHSTVSNNHANEGGGLHNKEHSTATIQNGTVFSGNFAEWSGGGIDNWGKITITESTLRENISAGEAGDAIASGAFEDSTASITGSCIVGNGDTAIFTNQLPSLDAIGNWWGSRTGPAHWTNPGGIGDSVSDFIDFSAWLTEPPSICAPQ